MYPMTEMVNVFEMKTHLSKHLERLECGEVDALIVARAGKPVARLTLEQRKSPVQIGLMDGRYAIPDHFDAMDAEIVRLFSGDEETD
ncbi:MAG: type II toxin-antitoxin system prevent-host-death family antitoxin [Candidatus Igneacidithiobacillus chanchocoensis]